jgi:hypothetical protein
VIKIRLRAELSPGLNAYAERGADGTIVYLLPGLTPAQRSAALRRLRQQARMRVGPPLPPRQLAVALAVFRVRDSALRLGAIFRLHPAASMVPMLMLSAIVATFVLTSMSVRIVPSSQAAGPGAALLPSPGPSGSGQVGGTGSPPAVPGAIASLPGGQPEPGGTTGRGSTAPSIWPGAPEATSSGSGGNPLTSVAAQLGTGPVDRAGQPGDQPAKLRDGGDHPGLRLAVTR